MLTRLTQAQVIEAFGQYAPFLHADGTIDAAWEAEILGSIELPAPMVLSFDHRHTVSHMRCHKRIVAPMKNLFDELFARADVWATINDLGGCYAWRANRRNAKELSRHAWGIACDMDVGDNPQGRLTPNVHPALPFIIERHGFVWGGDFKGASRDPMHFEFADLGRLR